MISGLLYRQELSYLKDWSVRSTRKPLVIRGARQVGKSTLVKQFAEENNFRLLTLNFERNPEFRKLFLSNNPVQILTELELITEFKIEPGKMILFLDEIQSAPEALPSLRYFYEEKPELHIVAAGSLLEFTLSETSFSMPVGRIEYMHLGPLRFMDFLKATGHVEWAEFLDKLSLEEIQNNKMPGLLHEKIMDLLRQYWITGGLPEAVASYVRTNDFSEVSRIQQNIVATYRDDFHKYRKSSSQLVQMVFDHLPVMIGRKFIYAQVSRDHRAAELNEALQQLCLARVIIKVFHTSANGVPLAAEKNHKFFKTVYLDIGLLSAALKLNVLDLKTKDMSLVNNGTLAEQFIGQHLAYIGNSFEEPELFYWIREAKSSAAEVDYVIASGQHVVPVEIKAGTTGTLKSLHQFLKEKQRKVALRFNADIPSMLNDQKRLTNGSMIDYRLLSLPLYMVEQTPRLIRDCL